MKKIIYTVAVMAMCISAAKAQDDKAFKKGDITASLGIGFGVYGTKVHTEYDQQVFNLATGFSTVRYKQDTTDGAASAVFPLEVEYGVTNWLGLGGRFAFSNYTRDSTNTNARVHSLDADLMVNVHLVKSRRFDMPLSLYIGYSNIKYLTHDAFGSMAKDNGMSYGIALVPRIYFGDHIGMFFNVGYAGYNYPSLQFSNDTYPDLNSQNNWLYSLKGNGLNMGLGLIGKF
jgi:hypothetical protein